MKLLVVFVLLASTLHTLGNAQRNFPVTASISTPKSVVESGSEIRINVSIVNKSGQIIALYKTEPYQGEAEAGNHVHMYDVHQQELPRIDGPSYRKDGVTHHLPPRFFSRTTLHVEPGKTDEDFLILNKLFDLSKPGRYKVVVQSEIRHPVPESEDELVLVPSNRRILTLLESMPQRYTQTKRLR